MNNTKKKKITMTTEELHRRLVNYITTMTVATIGSTAIFHMVSNYHMIKEIHKISKEIKNERNTGSKKISKGSTAA